MSNKDYDATDQDNISKTDDEDDGKYVITEHALLYTVLKEYGIVVGEWYPKMWKHIYEDFMENLLKAGYIKKKEVG